MKNKESYTNLFFRLLNAATKDWTEDASSSEKIFSVPYFSKNSEDNTSSSYESNTSTEINAVTEILNNFSDIDRLVVRRNAVDDEAEKDVLVKRLVNELELELDLFDEENEYFSSAERKIIDIEHKYKMRILGEVILDIYFHHFDNPLYLLGICRALLRYDLDEVKPWGAALLAGLLNHPDERVKEYTIQLIDNWCDVELLPILKTLQVSTDWLRDYIKDVVESLEKENVLYQKAI